MAVNWIEAAPESGWKPRTYYVVEVTFNSANPAHRAILYTGFMDEKTQSPRGYSVVFNGTYGGVESIRTLHTLKVITEITDMQEPSDA